MKKTPVRRIRGPTGRKVVLPLEKLQCQPVEVGSMGWEERQRHFLAEGVQFGDLLPVVDDAAIALLVQPVDGICDEVDQKRAVVGRHLLEIVVGSGESGRLGESPTNSETNGSVSPGALRPDLLMDELGDFVAVAPHRALGPLEREPGSPCDEVGETDQFVGCCGVGQQSIHRGSRPGQHGKAIGPPLDDDPLP
jgi:hypothetical protein